MKIVIIQNHNLVNNMFKVPEQYRVSYLPYESKEGDLFGIFQIKKPYLNIHILATSGQGMSDWEHVSVSVRNKADYPLDRCPTWEEMCRVKDFFWDDTDTVIQFHPPKSEYVSQHKYTLHLWRKIGVNAETPPSILVGLDKYKK